MVIKSIKAKDHIENANEVFKMFWKFRMKLNPLKCAFRVSSGQFWGHVVSKRGVEPSPTQIKTLSEIQEPRIARDMQSLAGKVAPLNHFILKMSDRCNPFFWSIKQSITLEWGKKEWSVQKNEEVSKHFPYSFSSERGRISHSIYGCFGRGSESGLAQGSRWKAETYVLFKKDAFRCKNKI